MGLYLALQFDFSAVSLPSWGLLLFYALAACVWTVWLWMTGLRAVSAAQAGVFTVLLPVSAALVGMAFGIALASVAIATWPKPLGQNT